MAQRISVVTGTSSSSQPAREVRPVRLAFVVPAHERFDLARVCLRQLRRTCDALEDEGFLATAIVVSDDANLVTARRLDFATIKRDNSKLGTRWNDGFEFAARYLGCHYVIPFGSDDWVDYRLIVNHLGRMRYGQVIGAHRFCAIVNERGTRMAKLRIPYDGGDGIRIIPTKVLRDLRYRPAEDFRGRAIDTSIWRNLTNQKLRYDYFDDDPLQIVEFKSPDTQLNAYDGSLIFAESKGPVPWRKLTERYGAEPVAEVRELYATHSYA